MQVKRTSKAGFVEQIWKGILQQFDRGRQRSGKALAKQSEVIFQSIVSNRICARIASKGFDGGTYFVELPCIDNWQTEVDNIAAWLAHRLDLFAACLSGEWNDEFLAFIDKSRLRLFPDESYSERLKWEAKCTCNSVDPVCKHVVAVIFRMIWEMESDPVRAIEFVCINPEILFDKIHIVSTKQINGNIDMNKTDDSQQNTKSRLIPPKVPKYEQLVFGNSEPLRDSVRAMQIIPVINPVDFKEKREMYMNW